MARQRTNLALVPDTEAIGVVIAHRQRLTRAGFGALLEASSGVAVVGEAADAGAARELVERMHPAVVLMDIGLPGPHGTKHIASDFAAAGARIVILAGDDTDELLLPALRSGVTGVVLEQDADANELVRAVRAVAAGDGFLSPNVARRLIDEFAAMPDTGRPTPEQLDELTRRELEVVSLVARGMSNAEIAEHLVVSPATAKTHVSRALCKVHARDRSQLVTLAYESGLVVPQAPVAA